MVLLRLSEASKRCGIATNTLRNWIKKDQIEGVKRKTGDSYQYYIDERVIETICKSDTEYVVDEADKQTIKITNAMDRFSQQINGLSQAIRDIQTNAAIQANESNREYVAKKLDWLSQSQMKLYNSINTFNINLEDIKESVEIIKTNIVFYNKDSEPIESYRKDNNSIDTYSKDNNSIDTYSKDVGSIEKKPNPYNKFGGR